MGHGDPLLLGKSCGKTCWVKFSGKNPAVVALFINMCYCYYYYYYEIHYDLYRYPDRVSTNS